MVALAAAASRNAAVTPRLEIYRRDLPLVRALRLTQAGLVRLIPDVLTERQPGLTAADIHERVLARFPEITVNGQPELPTGGSLTKDLRAAGLAIEVGDGSFRLKKSFEAADKLARRMVILGEDEIASGILTVKDFSAGEQTKVPRADLANFLRG